MGHVAQASNYRLKNPMSGVSRARVLLAERWNLFALEIEGNV